MFEGFQKSPDLQIVLISLQWQWINEHMMNAAGAGGEWFSDDELPINIESST
jgi:hypothetical protein